MSDREQDIARAASEAAEPAERAEARTGPRAEASDEEAAFQRPMALGRKVMDDHRAVLAALAK